MRRCRRWNWCRWREVLPLIRRMIGAVAVIDARPLIQTMQGGKCCRWIRRMIGAVGVMDARPLIQTMQAVAVAVCCCCVPCLAVMVDGLPMDPADDWERMRWRSPSAVVAFHVLRP